MSEYTLDLCDQSDLESDIVTQDLDFTDKELNTLRLALKQYYCNLTQSKRALARRVLNGTVNMVATGFEEIEDEMRRTSELLSKVI